MAASSPTLGRRDDLQGVLSCGQLGTGQGSAWTLNLGCSRRPQVQECQKLPCPEAAAQPPLPGCWSPEHPQGGQAPASTPGICPAPRRLPPASAHLDGGAPPRSRCPTKGSDTRTPLGALHLGGNPTRRPSEDGAGAPQTRGCRRHTYRDELLHGVAGVQHGGRGALCAPGSWRAAGRGMGLRAAQWGGPGERLRD